MLSRLLNDIFGTELIFDQRLDQMGLDDLDQVELLLEIERELNIAVPDHVWEEFCSKPINNWVANFREQKIDQIIND